MKININLGTKLNAVEALVKLLKEWDEAKSVVVFVSSKLRFKATRLAGQNEILITFGRPNLLERAFYKKATKRGNGKAPRFLIKR